MKVLGHLTEIEPPVAERAFSNHVRDYVNLAPPTPEKPLLAPLLEVSFARRVLNHATKFFSPNSTPRNLK